VEGEGEKEENSEKKTEGGAGEGRNSLRPPPLPPLYTPATLYMALTGMRVVPFIIK